MALRYKDMQSVLFPVYALPCCDWYTQDGLLFFDGKILDDKNMKGHTIGLRRLYTPHSIDLYKLNNQQDNFRGILKSRQKMFIDTNGYIFEYEKTKFCQLKYYKVKKAERIGTGCRLYLYGVKQAFLIPRPPPPEYQWAGILHYMMLPWILYDYSETKLKDTRRKV